MVPAVIIAAGIISVSAIFTYMAHQVSAEGSYLTAFGLPGTNALVLLMLEVQHYAYLAAQVFSALWLTPLGCLAIKSRLFPKVLGIVLVLATASYLTDVLDGCVPAHNWRPHTARRGSPVRTSGSTPRLMFLPAPRAAPS